ncbi:MAG: VTT domain-containing protein [Rhodospirillaceae bacterium]
MSWRALAKGLVMLAVLAGIGFALKTTGIGDRFEKDAIDSLVKGQGWQGEALFVAAGALLTAVGFSRQAVAFMGGYAFGIAAGTGISTLAAAVGCTLTFCYARFFGRAFVARRFSDKIRRIDAFLGDHPFTMTLLIRFLPVGSNVLTNLAAGVSSVSGPVFVIASAIGYIPQMLIFALVGGGVHLDTGYGVALSALLFVVSGLLGGRLYRKYRHGVRLGGDVDGELDGGEAPAGAAERN